MVAIFDEDSSGGTRARDGRSTSMSPSLRPTLRSKAKPRLTEIKLALPSLRQDVKGAAELHLDDNDYDFRLFSVGERGTSLEPALVNEVCDGLLTVLTSLGQKPDCLVSPQPAGTMWALLLVQTLRIPLKVITTEPSGLYPQTTAQQRGGLHDKRVFYFPQLVSGTKAVVIDDVLSTGSTAETIVRTLSDGGVTMLGVLCIVDKNGMAKTIERRLGIPVRCLVNASDDSVLA